MPDWLLTIPRLIWTPIRWADRRLRQRGLDRYALVKEGSDVVTPVIQYTKNLGPGSIMWGSDEENRVKVQERADQWPELRDELMKYANHHPSDRVRSLAEEVENVVSTDLNQTALLLAMRRTATTSELFKASEKAHRDALVKTERLMNEIRRY